MREITIHTFCDRCADQDQREPATTAFTAGVVESTRSRPQLRVVELCETHSKELQDLREFLVSRGIAPENVEPMPTQRAARGTGKHPERVGPCPACGHYAANPRNMAQHIYATHLHEPLPPMPAACPECGAEMSPQGLGVHRRLAHGTSSATDAYAALAGPVKRPRGRPRKST